MCKSYTHHVDRDFLIKHRIFCKQKMCYNDVVWKTTSITIILAMPPACAWRSDGASVQLGRTLFLPLISSPAKQVSLQSEEVS